MLRNYLLWVSLLACSAFAQTPEAVVGQWQGSIEIPGSPLEIHVIFTDGAELTGTIDIPAQGAQGLPLTGVSLDGSAFTFAIQGPPGNPTFTGTLSGDGIEGTFSQAGSEFPFTLTRADQTVGGSSTGGVAGSEASLSPKAALERFFTDKPIQADWFADSFLAQVPLEQLEPGLKGITDQLGSYESVAGDSSPFTVNFSQGTATVNIALDADGKISTLFIGNPTPAPSGDAAKVPVVAAFLGSWQGVVGPDSIALEVGVTFEEVGGALVGRITVPAQSFEGPLEVRAVTEQTLDFVITGVPGNPTFEATLVENELQGIFSQSGSSFPFTLARGDAPLTVQRPQNPQPPFPYREEEVTYTSGDITLAGTLTLPEGDGPFPAMLMITGSGPQDRDEGLFGHRPFAVIADAVTRAGVVVLRVDDRGVGGSGGDLAQATYDDLVSDIEAGVAFLKARPDIDGKRVGLFGHSEGGYLAPLAAARGADPAFVIMMAGPSVSGEKVLELQNRLILGLAGEPDIEVDAQIRFLQELEDALQREAYDEAGSLVETRVTEQFAAQPESERPSADTKAQIVSAQQENVVSPYFRSFILYDPQPALRQLDKPVLAFYGNLDVQVPPVQSVGPLRFALRTAGNDDVTIKVFDGLNHLMQPAVKGGIDEYAQIETTIAPEVLTTVTDWLKEHLE